MNDIMRVQIIKDILDSFGVFNFSIIDSLAKGESLADTLKSACVIYPIEYDKITSLETNNIGNLTSSLNYLINLVQNKGKMYDLYVRYCEYFLGLTVSYVDLSLGNRDFSMSLIDENGLIDYKPYLEALGITDLQHISEQYSGKGR